VLFADCCRLTEEKESRFFVSVTLTGALIYTDTIEKKHFL
jgi:hypothetical protein